MVSTSVVGKFAKNTN